MLLRQPPRRLELKSSTSGQNSSNYGANLQAKVVELDGSCKTSLAALQLLHQEASLEMNNPQAAFNESNSKVATRSQKLATAIAGLEAKTQQAEAPHQPPRKPLQ